MHRYWPHLLKPVNQTPSRVCVATETGPLEAFGGASILVVADAQNLDHSCRDLNYRLSWARLGDRLRRSARRAFLHTVFSRSSPDDHSRWNYFSERGWTPHVKNARVVSRRGSMQRDSNADHHFAFFAAYLAGRLSVQWVVLATGDGMLGLDCAEALASLPSAPAVATLSVAGSTARRLDARICNLIRKNVEVGRDVLQPLGVRMPTTI